MVRREWSFGIVAALAIAFVTRPVSYLAPQAWTEASWQSALHAAAHSGLNFGGDSGIYFTYGPLGFMDLPTYWYGFTGALAVLARLAELTLLAWLLIAVLRERLGLRWACAVTFALMSLQANVVYSPPLPLAALVAAIYVVTHPRADLSRWLAVAGGALAGYALLGRVNSGVIMLLVLVVALAALEGRKVDVPACLGAALLVFAIGWFATGNAAADIPSYAHGAFSVVGSYSEAFGIEENGFGWQYPVAALFFAAGIAGIGVTTNGRARYVLLVVWALFGFSVFKQGFVRHDFLHVLYFFQALAIGVAVLPWQRQWARYAIGGAVLAGVIVYSLSTDLSLRNSFDWDKRVRSHAHALALIVAAPSRADKIAAGHHDILERRAVSRRYIEALRRAPSTVWPSDLSIVAAADGKLRPLPTLQSYGSSSSLLDDKNVRAIDDDGAAPAQILYLNEIEFDRRLPAVSSPATARAILCHYRLDGPPEEIYALLKRSENRCTTPARAVKTVQVAWGETVPVPAPSASDRFVFARIEGVQVAGAERVLSQLFKAYERNIDFTPNPLNPTLNRHYRLVPGTAGDGILMRSGAGADLPGTLAFAPQTTSLRITRAHQPAGRPLKIEFFEQAVAR